MSVDAGSKSGADRTWHWKPRYTSHSVMYNTPSNSLLTHISDNRNFEARRVFFHQLYSTRILQNCTFALSHHFVSYVNLCVCDHVAGWRGVHLYLCASISRLSGKRNYVIVSFVANAIWFITGYTKIGASVFLYKRGVQTHKTDSLWLL
jgi:hypothetical protein